MSEDLDLKSNSLSVKKNKGGNPNFIPHQPTEEQINLVKSLVKFGVKTSLIAGHLRISEPTLFKYYQEHMDDARVFAHAGIGQSLYNKAINGDTASAIWYSKTQMGWKEDKADDTTKEDDDFSKAIDD